jgi:hypothetical protein
MTNRLHTINIEGLPGPITVKGLTKRQWAALDREPDAASRLVALLKRAVLDPDPAEMLLRGGCDPDKLAALGEAILERSWPRAEL